MKYNILLNLQVLMWIFEEVISLTSMLSSPNSHSLDCWLKSGIANLLAECETRLTYPHSICQSPAI